MPVSKFRKILILLLLLSGFVIFIPSFASAQLEKPEKPEVSEKPEIVTPPKIFVSEETNDYVENEVLVKRKFKRPERIKVPDGQKVEIFIRKLQTDPTIEYAEPNYYASALFVPNDPYYSPYQWNFPQIKMEEAWDKAQGNGVTVAVIDTGLAYEDYRSGRQRFKKAPDFNKTSFVPGFDFVGNDSHPNDDNGHGTHVAGTIAQSTNNNLGAAGIAYKANLMPIKVLNKNGSGTYGGIAEGIYFAVDNGAQIINLSLGGKFNSQTLKDAVAYAYEHGVTVVAAAGNDGAVGKNSILYPAAYDEYVLAVGAVRFDKSRAWYSNGGASLDLVGPGGDLKVDQNSDGYGDGILQQTIDPRNPQRFAYYFYQGTSMAAAHVTGVVALLVEKGFKTPSEIRSHLQEKAQDLGEPGKDDNYGFGLIDAGAALGLEVESTPSAPGGRRERICQRFPSWLGCK